MIDIALLIKELLRILELWKNKYYFK